MEWVEHFIALARKVMSKVNMDIYRYQKEFEVNSKSILTQMISDLNLCSEPKESFYKS